MSSEIRQFLVESVRKTGGHLGSNLGAVELTIALHRVFDSPRDLLLFDTGHQAYVHKLLTGRMAGFEHLKQEGGLSGYPNRRESPHDLVENSHASTALSYAYGMASALQIEGEADPTKGGRRVVAVVGDGALTGGLAYEALNNLGHSGARVLIVLNDNGRSYAPTISKLSGSLTQLRLDPRYVQLRERIRHGLRDLPSGVGSVVYTSIHGLTSALREVVEPHVFFEALGVRYTGPLDGHDIPAMEQAMRRAAAWQGPIVLHVLTKKGKGYGPAEDDEIQKLHDFRAVPASPPVPSPPTSPVQTSGAVPASAQQPTIRAVYHRRRPSAKAIRTPSQRPSSARRRLTIGSSPSRPPCPGRPVSSRSRTTFRSDSSTSALPSSTAHGGCRHGDDRPPSGRSHLFDVPRTSRRPMEPGRRLAQHARRRRGGPSGNHRRRRPVPSRSLRHGAGAPNPQCVDLCAVGACRDGPALAAALASRGPALVRYPKTLSPGPLAPAGFGLQSRTLREGSGDIVIVGIGKLARACLEAASLLETDGLDVTVVDPRVVRPADPALIDQMVSARLVVTAEDGLAFGGAGSFLCHEAEELAAERDVAGPQHVVLGVPTTYIAHGKPDAILRRLGLDGPGIAASTRAAAMRFSLLPA